MTNAINVFGETQIKQQASTLMQTQSDRESQEVQAMMIIAKRFPRDPVEAMQRILNACTRPTLAAGAVYSYPRGGQNIEGPSIRLAETLAQEWGNIQYGIRELSQANGESTVEAFAWDIQTNTRQVKVFQVPHIRYTKKGQTRLTDPRDIYELIANNGARRLRACILGVIPGDVVEEAVKQCGITQNSNVNLNEDTLKALEKAFNEFGVTQKAIETRLQCKFEAMRPAQYIQLRKIYTSLRDGMSSAGDWFVLDTKQTQPSDLNELLNQNDVNKSE